MPRRRSAAAFTFAVAAKGFSPFAIVFATPNQACFARMAFAAKGAPLDIDYVH